MKYRIICILFLSLFVSTTQASTICSLLPGFWQGKFSFLKDSDCQKFGGCTHRVSAYISNLSGSNFTAKVILPFGEPMKLHGQCNEGEITLTELAASSIGFACDASNKCLINYESPEITASFLK